MVDIEIKTVCNVCGNEVGAEQLDMEIAIDPCKNCLEKEYDEGFNDGQAQSEF